MFDIRRPDMHVVELQDAAGIKQPFHSIVPIPPLDSQGVESFMEQGLYPL